MPPRAVSILCLLQVLLLSLAWLLTSRFIGTAEKSWGDLVPLIEMPMFRWLHAYSTWGLLLLLIPVGLALLCAKLSSTHQEMALVSGGGFRVCVTVTLLSAFFGVFTVWNAFQLAFRPPLITLLGPT